MKKTLLNSILSGILISLGSYAFSVVGGIIGAILFSFGLLSIIYFGIPLYTGAVGNVGLNKQSLIDIIIVLLGNLIGCLLISFLYQGNIESLSSSVDIKMSQDFFTVLSKGILCGVIIDCAVFLSKKKESMLPVLIGVPLFIMSGFLHSIAEPFYLMASKTFTIEALGYWSIVLLGNTIGCNLRRIFV